MTVRQPEGLLRGFGIPREVLDGQPACAVQVAPLFDPVTPAEEAEDIYAAWEKRRLAQMICRLDCPIRDACLAYAVRHTEKPGRGRPEGIWGGEYFNENGNIVAIHNRGFPQKRSA